MAADTELVAERGDLVREALAMEDVALVAGETYDLAVAPDATVAHAAVEVLALLEEDRAVREPGKLLDDPSHLSRVALGSADGEHNK